MGLPEFGPGVGKQKKKLGRETRKKRRITSFSLSDFFRRKESAILTHESDERKIEKEVRLTCPEGLGCEIGRACSKAWKGQGKKKERREGSTSPSLSVPVRKIFPS